MSAHIVIYCDAPVGEGTCYRAYPALSGHLERAEKAAYALGWLKTSTGHICPEHAKEIT